MTIQEMLQDFSNNFSYKVGDDLSLIVQIEILMSSEYWHILIESGQVTLKEGQNKNARFSMSLTEETLQQIYDGKINALTAAARAHITESAPLDFKLREGLVFSLEIYHELVFFIQRFFNRFDGERVLFNEEQSRSIHGGHAVTLYADQGFRSAWYLVKKGEQINESGDTNPFPQAFVILSGRGFTKIGDKTIEVKAGESYYIGIGTEHIVWTDNDEPLTLIWMAWGAGA